MIEDGALKPWEFLVSSRSTVPVLSLSCLICVWCMYVMYAWDVDDVCNVWLDGICMYEMWMWVWMAGQVCVCVCNVNKGDNAV